MPEYRFYKLHNGHIKEPPAVVSCSDDVDAIRRALNLPEDVVVEVWDRDRFVTRIEPSRE